jgi:hypothetical protein
MRPTAPASLCSRLPLIHVLGLQELQLHMAAMWQHMAAFPENKTARLVIPRYKQALPKAWCTLHARRDGRACR